VLDVQISVAAFDPLEAFKAPLEALRYVYRPDNPERTKRYSASRPALHARISTSAAREASPSSSR
jgi:hypothetical protein